MEEDQEHVERTADVLVDDKYLFTKFALSENLQKSLKSMNFIKPSPIQLKIIPFAKSGLDMIIQSKSGTGKTLAFLICLLESFDTSLRFPQAIILAPTREISVQIVDILNGLGKHIKHFKACEFIGGTDLVNDRKRIQAAKVAVGTPGRIAHLIRNDVFNLSDLRMIILDEVDKLLDNGQMGKDVTALLRVIRNKNLQVIASTATVTNNLDNILKEFTKNPIFITPKHEVPVLLGIKQYYIKITKETDNIELMKKKIEYLQKIFSKITFKQCLLFTNSQSKTDTYGNYLKKAGWKNEIINGSQDQAQRLKVLQRLIDHKCRILIATDLMARGIDIENINVVINLDLPYDCFTYLHRIGRAGRFGTHGIAITILNGDDDVERFQKMLQEIGANELSVLEFPLESNCYNFWDFNDKNQDKLLPRLENISNENNGIEENGNVEDNLILLELSSKLIDHNCNKTNSININDLLSDYERVCENKEVDDTKQEIASQVVENSSVFANAIRDLNLYDDEEQREQSSFKEERHVIFLRKEESEEIFDSSSGEEDEGDDYYESEEEESSAELEVEKGSKRDEIYGADYESYDQYVANFYTTWRNIYHFQLASINNYLNYS